MDEVGKGGENGLESRRRMSRTGTSMKEGIDDLGVMLFSFVITIDGSIGYLGGGGGGWVGVVGDLSSNDADEDGEVVLSDILNLRSLRSVEEVRRDVYLKHYTLDDSK